ncbi:MAG TPA: hypothetical protein VG346_02570 [Acidimicrobiales bacterium]|nr:hypothetical protein [Acidimicrobiales bacterium]
MVVVVVDAVVVVDSGGAVVVVVVEALDVGAVVVVDDEAVVPSVPDTAVSAAKTVLTPTMENEVTTGTANAAPTPTRVMNWRRSKDFGPLA